MMGRPIGLSNPVTAVVHFSRSKICRTIRASLAKHAAAKAPGSVWYLRLSDPHSVYNKGNTDRVHLVIDAVANDWMMTMIETALGDA
jgi:hypothetical protein